MSTLYGVSQFWLRLVSVNKPKVIGEVDEEVDSAIDLSSIRAPPLKPLMH